MSQMFTRAEADVYFDKSVGDLEQAYGRVTQLCVAAHQDDIEIMAYAGILECFEQPSPGFGGVVVTNGAGSPRSGLYSKFTDLEMQDVRRKEQREAAQLGRYTIQIQLGHSSRDVKQPGHPGVEADLTKIFAACRPEKIYLHNPLDKHDTHVAVFLRSIAALRSLPREVRPRRVLGCAVWRDLEWLTGSDKIALESGLRPELAGELLRVFDSQIAGGKRYDLATIGRRQAHATFDDPHAVDRFRGITWAMDLTPLVENPSLDLAEYTVGYIERLRSDVVTRLAKFQ